MTKEEILKLKLGGEFEFKTFTTILTKKSLDIIYSAMQEYADQFKKPVEKSCVNCKNIQP